MQFQTGGSQVMPVVKQDIVHFPEFSFLSCCNRCLAGFQTALVDFCKREMPEIKTDLPLKFFHNFLYHFMRFRTIFIFVFPEFHQGYRSCIRTNEYVPWFNDLYDLFLKRHNVCSFKIFPLLYNRFPCGKLSKKPPVQTIWQEA